MTIAHHPHKGPRKWHKAAAAHRLSRLAKSLRLRRGKKMAMRKLMLTGLGLASLGLAPVADAQAQRTSVSEVQVMPARWRESFDAFAAADKAKPPAPGGVVFVGSSSIRLWTGLESTFESMPVIQRGFGGSRMLDCAENLKRLVLPYKPRLVVVYAGDNDIAEGRSPQEVLASFQTFVQGVRDELPNTRIAYISIKPSPLRASLMPKTKEANALIEQYASSQPGLAYVDVYTPMLGDDGQPRRDLYSADSLHMNATGYALWKRVIGEQLLRQDEARTTAAR